MRPRPVGPQAGGSGRGPGEVSGGFWQAVGLLGLQEVPESAGRAVEGFGEVPERFRELYGR